MATDLPTVFEERRRALRASPTYGPALEAVGTTGQNLYDLGKQTVAGTAENLVASPDAIEEMGSFGRYVPNFVWGLSALGGLGVEAIEGALGVDTGLDTETAARYAASGTEYVNDALGTENPDTILSSFARFGLPGLLPLPGLRGIEKLGPVARASIDFALPMLQSRSIPGVLGSSVAPFLLDQGLTELTEPTADTIFDVKLPSLEVVPAASAQTAEEAGKDEPDLIEVKPVQPNVDSEDYSGELMLLLATGLGIASGVRAARAKRDITQQGRAAQLTGETQEPAPVHPGRTTKYTGMISGGTESTVNSAIERFETQFIDRNTPLYRNLKRAGLSEEQLALMEARIRLGTTTQAQSSILRNTMMTGILPNSRVQLPRLANHYEGLSTLTPAQRALYDDALIAGTILDDMDASGVKVWGAKGRTQVTRGDLQDIVNRAADDPKVQEYIDEARYFYNQMAEYLAEQGIISNSDRIEWAHNAQRYVPIVAAEETAGLAERSGKAISQLFAASDPELVSVTRFLRERGDLPIHRVQPGVPITPSNIHERYLSAIVRYAEVNNTKRNIIDHLVAGDGRTGLRNTDGEAVVKKVGSKYKGDDVITVRRAGNIERYRVIDPGLHAALQFSPQTVFQVLNTPRRIAQEFTTGTLNPLFAPTSAMYELFGAMTMKPSGRAAGIIDRGMDKVLGRKLSDIIGVDPSHVLSIPVGTMRGIYGQMLGAMQRNVDLQLRKDGNLVKMIGEPGVQRLSKILTEAYDRSTYTLFMRGAGNAIFLENAGPLPTTASALHDLASNYTKAVSGSVKDQLLASGAMRAYRGLLNSIHNSVRLDFLANNVRRDANSRIVMSPEEVTRVLDDTRRLTGDVTQQAGDPNTPIGKVSQAFTQNAVYANHFVQVSAQLARMFQKQPRQTLTAMSALGMSGLGFLATQFNNDPEAEKHYWDTLTVEQRASFIPIYEDGKPKALIMIPPEMRPFWAPVVEATGSMFGFKSQHRGSPHGRAMRNLFGVAVNGEFNEADFTDLETASVGSIAQSVLPDPFGPTARLGANILGAVDPQNPYTGRGTAYAPINRAQVIEDPEGVQRTRYVIEAIMMGAARQVWDSALAFRNATKAEFGTVESLEAALEAAGGRFRELQSASIPPGIKAPWALDRRISVGDTAYKMLRSRFDGLDLVQSAYGLEHGPGSARPLGLQQPVQSLGTELAVAQNRSRAFARWKRRFYDPQMAQLRRRRDELDNKIQYNDPATRRAIENAVANEVRFLNQTALERLQETERIISRDLGREFRFNDFQLEQLRKTPFVYNRLNEFKELGFEEDEPAKTRRPPTGMISIW